MRTAFVLTGLMAILAALPAAAPARETRDCGFTGTARVLAENPFGRVLAQGREVRACRRSGRHVRELEGRAITDVRMAGHFVAYQSVAGGVRNGHVLDLWRGPEDIEATNVAVGPLVNRLGASVWSRRDAVWRADARGAEQVDAGPGIDPRSLALTPIGNRFYWMRDGVPRTAYLATGTAHPPPPPMPVRRPDAASCRLRGRIATVEANRFGRVIRRRTHREEPFYDYVACDARGRHAMRLGSRDLTGFVADVVLNGRFVAYTHEIYDRQDDPDETHAYTVDVTSGRRTRRASDAIAATVTPGGALAVFRTPDEGRTFSLELHHARGRTVLDAGPSAQPGSVAADERGTRLYWLHGREARTALV